MRGSRAFICTAAITSISGISVLCLLSRYNRRQYESSKEANISALSRPNLPYFGLNGGTSIDMELYETIDSGDCLSYSLDCSKQLTSSAIFRCFLHQAAQRRPKAVVFRDRNLVKVIYDEWGCVRELDYPDFVALPGLKSLKLRRLDTKKALSSPLEEQRRLREIQRRLREMYRDIEAGQRVDPEKLAGFWKDIGLESFGPVVVVRSPQGK